jgi:opacity protein-like surface antigen
MKKIIFTATAVLAFVFSNAQDAKFGAKGGLDLVSISGGGGSTTGFTIGGFAEFNLSDKVVLQPGLNYHTATQDNMSWNFISIPVIAKFNVADKINLLAGPSLFYNLESEATDKTTFNLDFGASYDINDHLFIEPRYSAGLTGDFKVNHFIFGLGYKF